MRAIAVAIVLLTTPAWGFSLLSGARTPLQRCIDRCERNHPQPTPTVSIPAPTKPTPQPLPCEALGTKHYEPGQEIMMCFDVASDAPGLVSVSVENEGNSSCGELAAELRGPTGLRHYSFGPQPNTILPRVKGRYYLWTKFSWGCNAYTFRARG